MSICSQRSKHNRAMLKTNLSFLLILPIIGLSFCGEFVAANPYDPTTGKGTYHIYEVYNVDSPKNMTYHTNHLLFNLTIRTNWGDLQGSYRYFYVLDGPSEKTLDQVRVELVNPTKVTTKTVNMGPNIYPFTEYTYEFSFELTGLSDGSHSLIWGITSANMRAGSGPLVSTLKPNLYFTVNCHLISLQSPKEETYQTSQVSLTFSVNEPCTQYKYSIDGQDPIQIGGNMTLNDLQNGEHTITVYAGFPQYNSSLYYMEGFGYLAGYQTQWLTNQTHFTVNAPAPTQAQTSTPTQSPTLSPTAEPTHFATPQPTTLPSETVKTEATSPPASNEVSDRWLIRFWPIFLVIAVLLVAAGLVLVLAKRKS
jgi:hypothetical protein